jgi:alpha-ribazole phosphatase
VSLGADAPGVELMRHGDTGRISYRGQLDDALSPMGWAQLRTAVAGRHWDAFATELAARRGLPLRLDARLAEYHFGEWQGVPIETLQTTSPDALHAYWSDPARFPPPGAEPFAAFRERLSAALDEIAAESHGRRVLVLTHGAAIRLLRCLVEGRDFGEMAGIPVDHASLHPLAWPPAGR